MTTIVSNRRASFGMNCVQCANELIAPEWSEYQDERHILHLLPARYSRRIDLHQGTRRESPFGFVIVVRGGLRIRGILLATLVGRGLYAR